MTKKPFSIIVAHDLNFGIGSLNTLPWRLSADMAYFKKTTTETKEVSKKNIVIMGRNTYESLPEKFRPLPNRFNIILSKTLVLPETPNAIVKPSLDAALDYANQDTFESVFVIGGATVYKEAIQHPLCEKLIVTKIYKLFDCDAFFPAYSVGFKEMWKSGLQHENNTSFTFHILQHNV